MLTSLWFFAVVFFLAAALCLFTGWRTGARAVWFSFAAGLAFAALRFVPGFAGARLSAVSTIFASLAFAAGFWLLARQARGLETRRSLLSFSADALLLVFSLAAIGSSLAAVAAPRAWKWWPVTSWPSAVALVLVASLVPGVALLSRVGAGRVGQTAWLVFESALAGAALWWADVMRGETIKLEARGVSNLTESLLPILVPFFFALAAGICAWIPNPDDEVSDVWLAGVRRIELVALVVLPGAALLSSLWIPRGGMVPLGAALVVLALARFGSMLWPASASVRSSSGGYPEFDRTPSSNSASLQRQLARRTHQLTTLHAVTADLNNTLDVEKLLSSALHSVCDAVEASSAAIWLRLDDANFSGTSAPTRRGVGSPENKPVGSAAVLLRELERSAGEKRAIDRLQSGDDGTEDNHVIMPTTQWAGRRWRMVQTRGDGGEQLQTMHESLEMGDLTAAAEACRTHQNLVGAAHIAAVRWKGEIIGALGVFCPHGESGWDEAERGLVDALALEVGAALRNAQLYQEASRQVDRDSLTDLLNHRALQGQLGAHLSRAQRTKMDFSVILMDVKNFKFFNDTYGHHIGDQVLRTVARCLTEATRTSDVLGRFGGDEFMAILLDTDSRGTIEVCGRIKERVEREAFQESNDGRRIPIALSFGAAMFPDDGKSVMDLIGGAQTQLESAKYGDSPMLGNLQKSASDEAHEMRKLREASEGGSFGVLDALVTAIDNKDHYTRRHSEDVTHWATMMGKQLEFSDDTQRAVRIAGLLHDVGKIAVPDSILRKPGRLNDEEFQIMQQHPSFGALIVKEVPHLTEVLGGIRHHHERFDGKGYPDKIAGEDIPLLGRLLAVPDCFSAMTTERPYRKAMTWAESIAEIEKGRGTQFDPVMADAFLEVIARLIIEKDAPAPHAKPDEEAFTNLRPRSVADMEAVA